MSLNKMKTYSNILSLVLMVTLLSVLVIGLSIGQIKVDAVFYTVIFLVVLNLWHIRHHNEVLKNIINKIEKKIIGR
ncbi:hypothetical protein [Bacillus phage vB_BsuS_PJN02]|uniref:Uncharacterized protein n=1 Tax=Bacillus phage vB_BsuS_PJN02 TaxID=2920374 RepID=A0AC61TS71_9CAUD|nr:hypothetical protein PQE76_gp002 [Bacillus phage vB_BsuS_PJN02]UNH58345.1 hypothetical protein [Bacillus phage vB_BsuS_PJN02]